MMKELTIEEMIKTTLKVRKTDPIFNQQYPNVFRAYKTHKTTQSNSPTTKPPQSRISKHFLTSKKLPKFHYIETNFTPYFKAHNRVKYSITKKSIKKDFDLADVRFQQFTDEDYSMGNLEKSESLLKASRFPTSPLSKSYEKAFENMNKTFTMLGKGVSTRHESLKKCKTSNFNRKRKSQRLWISSTISTPLSQHYHKLKLF
ncbi:hypothetical protein SteCoe_28383 [Stentor coeruleus]|uniref:Uncharacterized protein n=1 Tax=Stentor coeruleus TaxID=5963 RepID=A0A1R2B8F4_9CILI|nr:hypothetical protein SteCoe_28383 [Stentor coeruleus]